MGWIVLIIVCAILVFILFNISFRKKIKGDKPPVNTRENTNTYIERNAPIRIGHKGIASEETTRRIVSKKHKRIIDNQTKPYEYASEKTKSSSRYEWDKIFKYSIHSPFPEDLGPALQYLYEANRLEREGAEQILVQQLLEKARKLDSKATDTYITRWAIIKDNQRQKDSLLE